MDISLLKILLCEDSALQREVIGRYLKELGHEVLYAQDGEQAIKMFSEHHPDLVFIDVQMPIVDGYQAAQNMRQAESDFSQWTPIIFISSDIDEKNIVRGIEAGADDYLTKPISLPLLKAKIHAMCRLIKMKRTMVDYDEKLRAVNDKLLSSSQIYADLSYKDPLTGLGNRRAFEDNLYRICKTALRETKPVALLMIDVDKFKQFNDTYGHLAGDRCLQSIAHAIQSRLRGADFAARFGGEEFAVILYDTSLDGAYHVAETIRHNVEALATAHAGSHWQVVTVSIGAASDHIDREFQSELFIARADAALYQAKDNGRNTTVALKKNRKTHIPKNGPVN